MRSNRPLKLTLIDGSAYTHKPDNSSKPSDAFDPAKVWSTRGGALPNSIHKCGTKEVEIARVGFSIKGMANAPKKFEIFALTRSDMGLEEKKVDDLLHVKNAEWNHNNESKTWFIPKGKRSFFACYGLRLRESVGDVDDVILSNIQMWEMA